MDKNGNFNFGPSCSHLAAVVTELLAKPFNDVDCAVAKNVVSLLHGGECLQLGIGAMPNAVGSLIAQSDLKDFGVNSEMYVDGFVDLSCKMHLKIARSFFKFQLRRNFVEQVPIGLQIRDGMRRVNLDNADGPGSVGMAHRELVKVLLFEVAQKLFALFRSRLRDGINRALEVDEQRVVLHDVVVLELLDAMHHDINIVFTSVQEFVFLVIIDVGLEVCKMDRRTRLHLLREVFCNAIVRTRIR